MQRVRQKCATNNVANHFLYILHDTASSIWGLRRSKTRDRSAETRRWKILVVSRRKPEKCHPGRACERLGLNRYIGRASKVR